MQKKRKKPCVNFTFYIEINSKQLTAVSVKILHYLNYFMVNFMCQLGQDTVPRYLVRV